MIPYIESDVIAQLEQLYPDKSPDLSMEEKLIWFAAGQVSVVRHLKEQLKLQEETKYVSS